MSRLRVAAVVALALCCCGFFHASRAADTSLSTGLKRVLLQDADAPVVMRGADDQQAVVVVAAGEAEEENGDGNGGGSGRTDLELEDYPGSGANDRHSPWREQRRN